MISFQHRIVRDLWWALSSPSLFGFSDPESNAVFIEKGIANEDPASHLDLLTYLDQNPTLLTSYFPNGYGNRLGKYVEKLIYAYLDLHPDYKVILFSHQIKEGKITIGELDLIYQNIKTKSIIHLELAVKFYLGTGNTGKWKNWYGPNAQDRLDLKLNKLLKKQVHMSSHPVLEQTWQSLGFRPQEKHILLKGLLFYPKGQLHQAVHASLPDHLRSFWTIQGEFEPESKQSIRIIPRLNWLSENRISDIGLDTYNGSKMRNKPQMLAEFGNKGREISRFFVVPTEWKEKVQQLSLL